MPDTATPFHRFEARKNSAERMPRPDLPTGSATVDDGRFGEAAGGEVS
jgi:hypothetical protein